MLEHTLFEPTADRRRTHDTHVIKSSMGFQIACEKKALVIFGV